MDQSPSLDFSIQHDIAVFYIDLIKAYFQLQYVFFYGVESIFSFDPFKIASDQSNISQKLRLVSKWSKQILFTS